MPILGPIRVTGKRQIPATGGVLILANHLSDLDPLVVQVACPRPIHFMAKSELFDMPIVGAVLKGVNSFPVKRGEPDRQALKHAVSLLRDGEVVCVFPEGQLSETGTLQELKAGMALIVRQAACNVICLGIEGTQRVIPYGRIVPRPSFRRIKAMWGAVRRFTKDSSSEEILGWATSELRRLGAP